MTNLVIDLCRQRTRKSPCSLWSFSVPSVLSSCFYSVALALLTVAINSGPVNAQTLPRAKALSKRVMCMCGGCEDSAGLCSHPGGTFSGPCDTARGMQKDLDARVARNESDDAILQAYVEQYGPTVLVEPPKKGFDLLAWVMPVLLPLIALILVWQVVRRWKQKAALAPAGGPPIDAAFLERVQREAGREATKDRDE
jgi:cytochrome c-type biogenesis protein CcmH/NrfF